MSWRVSLIACPRCSAPVTFGGGITMQYGVPGAAGSAVNAREGLLRECFFAAAARACFARLVLLARLPCFAPFAFFAVRFVAAFFFDECFADGLAAALVATLALGVRVTAGAPGVGWLR